MTDPVTVGALASAALAMAAETVVKGAVGEAVKDAYKKLKNTIAHWASSDVEALEREPGSAGRKAVVAELIDKQSEADKSAVENLTAALIASLKKEDPVGIETGKLTDMEIDLGKLTVLQGTGIVVGEAHGGHIRVNELTVGSSPGK
jgi:leucyl aminopeptidase (aminopeptidase T)